MVQSAKLRDFFKRNETRIGEHYTTSPPFYYDSLRHGLDFFFKTFRSKNHLYENYAFSTQLQNHLQSIDEAKKKDAEYVSAHFTDDDNILLSLVSFQRFFELFTKSVLESIDERLLRKISNSKDFINLLTGKSNLESHQRIEAGEALSRIELLFSGKTETLKDNQERFSKLQVIKEKYSFFGDPSDVETIRFLNEWRNRLLHGGTVFPNLRAFDFFISKRVIPIIKKIIPTEASFTESKASFYLTTLTNIDLLKEIEELDFDLLKLEAFPLSEHTSLQLLRLGHLKEFGRANMKMNLRVRINHASSEYNYLDPLGRGIRLAEAERVHKDFVSISKCPCCGKDSLVLYVLVTDDIFNAKKKKHIPWVTCYTCTYHVRCNVGDPFDFGLSERRVFPEPEWLSEKNQ